MARAAPLLVLASAGFIVGLLLHGCSPAGLEGVLVLVEFEPGLRSRCVKVSATEAGLTRETDPMPLAGQASPLRVAGEGAARRAARDGPGLRRRGVHRRRDRRAE